MLKKQMDMGQEIIKIKIIDTIDNKTTIVELTDLQSLPENIKKIIQTVFPESLLIFVGKINSKLSVETLYKIAQTVHKIVGESLEWKIADKIPESMEAEGLSAYLLLRTKTDDIKQTI
jgi:hypothetical protein